MNNFRKYANGVARSGLLGAGLLGMYSAHKELVPESMGLFSCFITCVGLYALATYLLEGDYDESEGKDKDSPKPETMHTAETPISKKNFVTGRRICIGLSSVETLKVLENSPTTEETKLNKTLPKNFPNVIKLPIPDNISQDAKENLDLLKLGEPREIEEDSITTRTSPLGLTPQNPVSNSRKELDDIIVRRLREILDTAHLTAQNKLCGTKN